MTDKIRRFEVFILRPLQIVFLISAVVLLIKALWLWLVGCALCIFYLGIIGSKLHPLQSASELAEGPLEGRAARIESKLLPAQVKQMLVGHACTRVGILIGLSTGIILWSAFGWRWYFVLIVSWLSLLFAGAILKIAFRTSAAEA
jgi:hypothetical protein